MPSKSFPSTAEQDIREQLQRVLASPGFVRAMRMRRFLTYVVEGVLAGNGKLGNLKESVIGVAVFDREADYDPKIDPVVRVEARRLRLKLEEYYSGPGKDDALRIEIPKGSYVPLWSRQGPPPRPEVIPRQTRYRWWIAAAVAGALVVIMLLSRTWVKSRHFPVNRPLSEPQPITSLAVLPFRNLTNDPAKTYLIDGLTDEITTDLARSGTLKVISRTSADLFRNTNKTLPQIARELNVDAVVEGTFEASENRVRVTAQLIRAATDTHVWADTYQRDASDLFALQTEIAQTIARQIGVNLSSRKPVPAAQPANLQAYEAYLRGHYLWNRRTLDSLKKSIDCYRLALKADPNYARAYAALGESYVLLSSYGGPSSNPESFARAREAAETALRLDKNSAEAYVVLAVVKTDYDWDWSGATLDFQRALRLNPGYPTAHHWYALHLSRLGKHKEAEAEILKAFELDPLSLIISTDVGQVFYTARDPERALIYLNKALELDPNFADAHMVLGQVYELQRKWSEAIASFAKASQLFGSAPNVWALEGHALGLAGKRNEAYAELRKLEEASHTRYVSGVDVAIVYCGLGDAGGATKWLDKAYENHGKGLNMIGSDPLFDRCRTDQRFQSLLRRMRLLTTPE